MKNPITKHVLLPECHDFITHYIKKRYNRNERVNRNKLKRSLQKKFSVDEEQQHHFVAQFEQLIDTCNNVVKERLNDGRRK